MASGPITSWQTEGENLEVVTDFLFLGSKVTVDGDCSHEIRRRLLLGNGMCHGSLNFFPVFESLGCLTWTDNPIWG